MKQDNPSQQVQQLDTLYSDVRQIIETSRSNAVRSVDFCRVQMYWHMGQRIFEEEQHGKERADYGAYLLQNLAKRLEPEFGSGFGYRQLKFCRQFYRTYPNRNTLCSQLNWSQYRMLIQIPDPDKRDNGFCPVGAFFFCYVPKALPLGSWLDGLSVRLFRINWGIIKNDLIFHS